MQDFDAIEYIEDALTFTAQGLGPFVIARFQELTPELSNWPDILAQKDRQAGRNVNRYNPRDLSLMLRALTEHLGTLGYPFSELLTRQASNCASELRTVRNKWAHSEEFSVAETFRALDSAEILLRAIHADAEADHVAERKKSVLTFMAPPTTPESVPAARQGWARWRLRRRPLSPLCGPGVGGPQHQHPNLDRHDPPPELRPPHNAIPVVYFDRQ